MLRHSWEANGDQYFLLCAKCYQVWPAERNLPRTGLPLALENYRTPGGHRERCSDKIGFVRKVRVGPLHIQVCLHWTLQRGMIVSTERQVHEIAYQSKVWFLPTYDRPRIWHPVRLYNLCTMVCGNCVLRVEGFTHVASLVTGKWGTIFYLVC